MMSHGKDIEVHKALWAPKALFNLEAAMVVSVSIRVVRGTGFAYVWTPHTYD